MSRRLLAMLGFGGAAAQVSTPTVCNTPECGTAELVIKKRKPANGECPVCGTVAPKFEPKLSDYYAEGACLSLRAPKDAKIGSLYAVNAICRYPDKDDLPKSRPVRCTHCSAAFWQDAE